MWGTRAYRLVLCVGAFTLRGLVGVAQAPEYVKSVACPDIHRLDVDHHGHIYLAQITGDLVKYSIAGDLLLEYAPPRQMMAQKVNVSHPFRIMLFYEDFQQYVWLDRYLTSPVTYSLSDWELGYVEHIAYGLQYNAWLVDKIDFALKRVDLREGEVREVKSLAKLLNQQEAKILALHYHQNKLYLVDSQAGILVFGTTGNYLYTLDDVSAPYVSFDEDYLYYPSGQKLIFKPLYEGEDKMLTLPTKKYRMVKYVKPHLIGVDERGFDIYRYSSAK